MDCLSSTLLPLAAATRPGLRESEPGVDDRQ